mmetsp:Transcript_106191/g.310416  ORF Transcript_106191/g.310416 Transcript_106191/m.310416 type:complete len:244 (+) Transcript_106191:54-785(+)
MQVPGIRRHYSHCRAEQVLRLPPLRADGPLHRRLQAGLRAGGQRPAVELRGDVPHAVPQATPRRRGKDFPLTPLAVNLEQVHVAEAQGGQDLRQRQDLDLEAHLPVCPSSTPNIIPSIRSAILAAGLRPRGVSRRIEEAPAGRAGRPHRDVQRPDAGRQAVQADVPQEVAEVCGGWLDGHHAHALPKHREQHRHHPDGSSDIQHHRGLPTVRHFNALQPVVVVTQLSEDGIQRRAGALEGEKP